MDNHPIFVKIEEYKDVENILGVVQNKIDDAKKLMSDIDHLRHQEAQELDSWKNEVQDVENRVSFLQRSLFGGNK
jgi:archaellum component FlaC